MKNTPVKKISKGITVFKSKLPKDYGSELTQIDFHSLPIRNVQTPDAQIAQIRRNPDGPAVYAANAFDSDFPNLPATQDEQDAIAEETGKIFNFSPEYTELLKYYGVKRFDNSLPPDM